MVDNPRIIKDCFCSDGPSALLSQAAKVLRVASLRGSEVGRRGQPGPMILNGPGYRGNTL